MSRCYEFLFILSSPEHHHLLYLRHLFTVPGVVAEVVHEDDLPDEVLGAPVEHTHDGPQQGGARLVVESDDDRGWGERVSLAPGLGPASLAPGVGNIAVTGDLVTSLLSWQRRQLSR